MFVILCVSKYIHTYYVHTYEISNHMFGKSIVNIFVCPVLKHVVWQTKLQAQTCSIQHPFEHRPTFSAAPTNATFAIHSHWLADFVHSRSDSDETPYGDSYSLWFQTRRHRQDRQEFCLAVTDFSWKVRF